MWIFWALMACLGSTVWYIGPKFFSSQNPFSPIVISGLGAVIIGLIFSKIFYKTWFDPTSIPLGLLYTFTFLATIGYILSINAGGKIGPIAVIVELSVILATLVALFLFREQLNWIQIVGILLTMIGIGLVLYFQK